MTYFAYCSVTCLYYPECVFVTSGSYKGNHIHARGALSQDQAAGTFLALSWQELLPGSVFCLASSRVSWLLVLGPDGSQQCTRVNHVFLFICQWPSESALLIWLERTVQYKCHLQFLFSAKSGFTRKNIDFGGICKALLTC